MKKTAASGAQPAPSAARASGSGGLPKATKAVPVVPKKAVAPPPVAAAAPPPRPVPTNADEMKAELMLCVQVQPPHSTAIPLAFATCHPLTNAFVAPGVEIQGCSQVEH